MDSFRVCLLSLIGVTAITVVRKWNSDFLPLIRLTLSILISATVISLASPIVSYLQNLTEASGIASYAELLFKALGVAILTQCCAELCRESGEGGVAGGVELAGRIEILLISLPLINELLATAKELLELGG